MVVHINSLYELIYSIQCRAPDPSTHSPHGSASIDRTSPTSGYPANAGILSSSLCLLVDFQIKYHVNNTALVAIREDVTLLC